MLKYIIKRIALSVLILLGVALIIYVLARCMPSDFVMQKVNEMNQGGATVDQETIDAMYKSYGLEQIPEGASFFESAQIIIRGYFDWIGSICRLDFGNSFIDGEPVVDKLSGNKMLVSFLVALIATVFEFMIAIPLGITAARHQYSLRDYIVTIFVMVGISLPSFFFGQILKDLFSNKLGWFPPSGLETAGYDVGFGEKLLDWGAHLFVPILTVVILSIGARMRMTRTNMLEVLNSDYIRTARAKGLKERTVIYKHAFRNTMIPLVTSLAGLLPSLFSGALITEQLFDLPGIGLEAYKAMMRTDIPFIMGYNMFLALLSVIGVLLADLMYAVVDPRVKLE